MESTPFDRITHDPKIMGGRPCIRGLRVTVGTIVGLLAAHHTVDEILAEYPYLESDDVYAALAFAAWRMNETALPLKASYSPTISTSARSSQ